MKRGNSTGLKRSFIVTSLAFNEVALLTVLKMLFHEGFLNRIRSLRTDFENFLGRSQCDCETKFLSPLKIGIQSLSLREPEV